MAFFCADDDYKLYYDAFGDPGNPAIIFTYDLGGKRSFFDKQVDALKEKYYVITWDYRGHGAADHVHKQLNFERLAKDLKNLIEQINLSNVTLAGAGAGGAIMMNYIRLFGEENISRMILMDGSLKEIQTADWSHGRLKNDREAIDFMKEMTYDWKNYAPKLLEKMFGANTQVAEDDRKRITDRFLDNNNTLMMALMVGYITEDNRETAKGMTIPVLVTCGKDAEAAYLEKELAVTACFAHGQYKEFEGGTFHYYLDAEAFNKAVGEFMEVKTNKE